VAEDKLPRLVQAKYVDLGKAPTITTQFSDWNLNAQIPAATSSWRGPRRAQQIEFVRPGGAGPAEAGQ